MVDQKLTVYITEDVGSVTICAERLNGHTDNMEIVEFSTLDRIGINIL